MKNNNKGCIGILKWQLFWEEKNGKEIILWDGENIYLLEHRINLCIISWQQGRLNNLTLS